MTEGPRTGEGSVLGGDPDMRERPRTGGGEGLREPSRPQEHAAPGANDAPPRPRRTRRGEIVVGPSFAARYLPGAVVGLPIIALVLTPLGTAGIQQLLARPGLSEAPWARAVAASPAEPLLALCAIWILLALWAALPLLLTRRVVLLDVERGTICRRRGLGRRRVEQPLADVLWAVGEADREAIALIGLHPGGQAGARAEAARLAAAAPDAADPPEPAIAQWTVPHIGWDDASFDGLRALQSAAGLVPAAPRPVLLAAARRRRRAAAHREMAARIDMPWDASYEDDPDAFQRDFDHARRVLGGREPRR